MGMMKQLGFPGLSTTLSGVAKRFRMRFLRKRGNPATVRPASGDLPSRIPQIKVAENPDQEPFLFTEHLVLRVLTVEDARAVYGILNDGGSWLCARCAGKCSVALRDLQCRLARLIEYRRQYGFGLWTVCEKRTGAVVGICWLLLLEGHGPDVELIYRLRLPSWCKHYAREAVGACLRFGFEELNLVRIVAVVDPDEPVSARMIGPLEGAGMSYAQTRRLYGQETFLYAAERRERTEH